MKLNVKAVHLLDGSLHPGRDKSIGGSDAAAASGVSRYNTPFELMLQKTGRAPGPMVSPAMDRGTMLEPCFPGYLQREFPDYIIRRANVCLLDRQRRAHCHPDFFMEDPAEPGLYNVQCKTIGKRTWEANGGKPLLEHYMQVLHENAFIGEFLDPGQFLGSRLAYLVISESEFMFEMSELIERHPAAEAKHFANIDELWRLADAGLLPSPDYGRDGEALAAMYPPHPVDEPIDLTGDNRLPELLADRDRLGDIAGGTKKLLERNKAEIIDKLQGAAMAVCGPYKVKWQEEAVKGYTVAPGTRQRLYVSGGPKGEDNAPD